MVDPDHVFITLHDAVLFAQYQLHESGNHLCQVASTFPSPADIVVVCSDINLPTSSPSSCWSPEVPDRLYVMAQVHPDHAKFTMANVDKDSAQNISEEARVVRKKESIKNSKL
ncbi:unnamed protein product [Protopolystoma xenopodis]|uniref:Uncharacterized protein n=1 Tax=Protopolystoma xenopodis TaxID=117903 RepID=A0A3S5ATA4_9PLAT|nr:unnamed protein product [Protopolystoma xenopodis]